MSTALLIQDRVLPKLDSLGSSQQFPKLCVCGVHSSGQLILTLFAHGVKALLGGFVFECCRLTIYF